MSNGSIKQVDAVIVGAGFAGLYMLHELRKLNLTAQVYEAGDDVGGTWYWNRYPGARCDAESLAYSYSFNEELEQEWEWSERYATQPEILRYAQHVAKRFELYPNIQLNTKVSSAHFNEQTNRWLVTTTAGEQCEAQFCIMATGCLSVPQLPDIDGLDDFAGDRYQASQWPHEPVDFAGQRVGVIGTGSSAIQAIPVMARQARELLVFQRTPNFSVPARNDDLDADFVRQFKTHYREHRDFHKRGLSSGFGDLEIKPRERSPIAESAAQLTDAELAAACEEYWQIGGARFLGTVGDALLDETANARIAEFVKRKIRETVKDPVTADALCPTSHPIGTRRICVDIDYFETFNRSNVQLINLQKNPIVKINAAGIETEQGQFDLDALVLATGFDAMTGALSRIDIRGRDAQSLADKWHAGPRSYLGLMVQGFPNLFTITGPGSPSVLSNMLVSIEQHVDFIRDCIRHMQQSRATQVDADAAAENAWVDHVNEVANATLFPKGGSWYLGANVAGKPRVFMPYAAGVGAYREVCEQVVADNYRGFVFN